MKNEYTIHEFAQLYGIGTDTLRYYERLGLVHPKRGANGYRLYSLNDIYRLTIIRDLRELGISTASIGEYLKELSVEHTLSLLEQEELLIANRLKELRIAQKTIRNRTNMLQTFQQEQAGIPRMITLPERPCLRLNTDIRRDEEVDFAIKKLHSNHTDLVRDIGGQAVGAEMALPEILQGNFGHYQSVFFLLPKEQRQKDFSLPEGTYASLLYRGSYRQGASYAEDLLVFVQSLGKQPLGNMLELYHIDNRYTQIEEEFTTELQIQVG